jgi:hypothetical protein
MTSSPSSETWVAGYVIEFSDGGEPEDCERVADLIPAVVYSGARPITGARMVVCQCARRFRRGLHP